MLLNPWRFSSEFVDDKLELIYYNYRHYDLIEGRWLTRDLIEEEGTINLYMVCDNGGKDFDFIGLLSIKDIINGFSHFTGEKELWRQPLGSGFVILNLSFPEVSIQDCCDKKSKKQAVWVQGGLELELFYQLGYRQGNRTTHLTEKKFKGRDRNKKVPHPCISGTLIKLKRYNKAVQECKRKERNDKKAEAESYSDQVYFDNNCCKCPEKKFEVNIEGAFCDFQK